MKNYFYRDPPDTAVPAKDSKDWRIILLEELSPCDSDSRVVCSFYFSFSFISFSCIVVVASGASTSFRPNSKIQVTYLENIPSYYLRRFILRVSHSVLPPLLHSSSSFSRSPAPKVPQFAQGTPVNFLVLRFVRSLVGAFPYFHGRRSLIPFDIVYITGPNRPIQFLRELRIFDDAVKTTDDELTNEPCHGKYWQPFSLSLTHPTVGPIVLSPFRSLSWSRREVSKRSTLSLSLAWSHGCSEYTSLRKPH